MPYVVVKLVTGKSEDQKIRLAEDIAKDVMNILNSGEESVSGAFEEINSQDWAEKVYRTDIERKWERSTRSRDTRCE